jgi:hypothetical protein
MLARLVAVRPPFVGFLAAWRALPLLPGSAQRMGAARGSLLHLPLVEQAGLVR